MDYLNCRRWSSLTILKTWWVRYISQTILTESSSWKQRSRGFQLQHMIECLEIRQDIKRPKTQFENILTLSNKGSKDLLLELIKTSLPVIKKQTLFYRSMWGELDLEFFDVVRNKCTAIVTSKWITFLSHFSSKWVKNAGSRMPLKSSLMCRTVRQGRT